MDIGVNMVKMIVYLIVINIIAFFIYFLDKRLAMKEGPRISETALMLLSLIGGAIGALLSMQIFRHKTKKLEFYLVNILAIIIWIIILIEQ